MPSDVPFTGLAGQEAFIDAVPGHFEGDAEGQGRADTVLAWLARLRTL